MRDIDALLAEVKALDAAATPGPWHVGDITRTPGEAMPEAEIYGEVDQDFYVAVVSMHDPADARLIARSRTLLVELAEQVEWMRKWLLRLAEDVDVPVWLSSELRGIAAGKPSKDAA